MRNRTVKEYFEVQYKDKAFFSPNDIQFAVYDKDIWDFTIRLLRSSKTVVDLGAGGGTLLYNISKVTTAKLIGVDFSDTAVAYLKRKVPKAKIHKEDVMVTSLGNESCDFVVSTMTIEHVDDNTFLKEVYRILSPQGYFLVTTVLRTKNAWYFYKDKYGKTVLEPSHKREYTSVSSLLTLLNENGFTILKTNTPKIKFPLIDPFLKVIFGFIKNNFWNNLPATKLIEFLRKITRIPIPGYYAIEVVAQKQNVW